MENLKAKATATYNAAADYFDDPALGFWERFGQATVDRLHLRAGAGVLDVCAGSGASAIPAARRVGVAGRVVAVDLAENLLALGAAKARREGLTNIEFRRGDLENLEYSPESFDAVIVVFGIFFLPDWPLATRQLLRMVKRGGRLAVTTWGPDLFEPANTIFWSAVRDVRPDLLRAFNPWDRLTDPDAVRQLLLSAGALDVHVEAVEATHQLSTPADFWKIVLGSGYRGTIEAMTQLEQHTLRTRVVDELMTKNSTDLIVNVIYALATAH